MGNTEDTVTNNHSVKNWLILTWFDSQKRTLGHTSKLEILLVICDKIFDHIRKDFTVFWKSQFEEGLEKKDFIGGETYGSC